MDGDSIDGDSVVIAQAETAEEAPATAEPAPVDYDDLSEEVQAEAEHGPEGEYGEAAGGDWSYVWLLVALVILIVIAYRPAKRAILGALDARSARIKNELDEAQRLREEAQAALASFQRRQRDAMSEADEIIAHAREDAERMRKQALEDLEQVLARREQLAMERIDQAEANAAAEVRNVAVDVAITASRRLIAEQMDQKRAQRLVDEAIADLPNRLH
jgi:F-type H+-transporting ATPase subunit b